MHHWTHNSVFYHIYPLGLCGAPVRNDFYSPVNPRLDYIYQWIEHIKYLGINAVYIGPLFESSSHGYDTADYYHVDRRLGNRKTLAHIVEAFHKNDIKVIFDAVFNHTGRDFWAFRDVLQKGSYSYYCHWYQDLKFGKRSPFGDPFTYKSWKGHYSLPKLNLKNPYVKEHLFKAVEMWVNELGCDGLRLDAADCLKVGFIRDLKKYTKKLHKDFWLMGEIVHGNYNKRVNEKMLDSVTNYQCHHELITSFNKKNFSEVAVAFNRQFGHHGIYKKLKLYNFVDNHDINRSASIIKNQAHLYPMYALLFTMPGIPSLYYGSEWAIKGKKNKWSDQALRPNINLGDSNKNKELAQAINKFSLIRKTSSALLHGEYLELHVGNEHFAFARMTNNEYVIIILNSSDKPKSLEIHIPHINNGKLNDLLNTGDTFYIRNNYLKIETLWPNWARILKLS